MNIEQQIQLLIKDAPNYGITAKEVEAIAPVLKNFATELKHSEYYIPMSRDRRWLFTTINHRHQLAQQKNVIYAFPTFQAAESFTSESANNIVYNKVMVVDILLQILAMETVDSLIFFETPNNLTIGAEVSRKNLQESINLYLQKHYAVPKPTPKQVPPDIC